MNASTVLSILALGALVLDASTAGAQSVSVEQVRQGQAITVTQGPCRPSGVEVAPILGVVASIAAKALVGWAGDRLEARKEGLTGQFVASGVITPPTAGSACLRLYRGPIGQTGVPEGADADPVAAFLFEADVTIDGNKVWVVEPKHVVYRASSARQATKTKHVSVVIALTETAPADPTKPDEGRPVAVFRHDLGALKLRASYSGKTLAGTAASAAVSQTQPLNVTALVTESAEAGPVLTALIGAFNDNKDKLTEALTDIVEGAVGGTK